MKKTLNSICFPFAIGSVLTLTLILASPCAIAQQPTTYAVIDLGVGVIPNGINDNGEVVGELTVATSTTSGFHFDAVSGLTELLGTRSASAINDSGDIVGSIYGGGSFFLNGADFVDFGVQHSAEGINNAGQVAGSQTKPNPHRPTPLPMDAAVYDMLTGQWSALDVAKVYSRGTRKGVYADLYRLKDINDLGFSVGVKSRSGLYGSSSILVAPGSDTATFLPINGGGEALAINNFGQVVGRTGVISGAYTAYVYDLASDSVTDLGTLDGGAYSIAYDINDTAEVVGTSSGRGFLYHNGQLDDLNDLVETGSGFVVTSANAINEFGDIAATGTINGESHGLLLLTSDPNSGGGGGTENVAPTADIQTNRTRGRTRTKFLFDGRNSTDSDGTIVSYAWDFGDDTGSDKVKLRHQYSSAGVYTATLTVTDDGGLTASSIVEITVR